MWCKLAVITLLVSMARFAVGAPMVCSFMYEYTIAIPLIISFLLWVRRTKGGDLAADIKAAIDQEIQTAEALATGAIAAGVPVFSIALATTLVERAAAPIATGAA
ncbi:hypothetical protein B0H14DRAFT_3134415 [Mycena olivaceomarginata]|nr:hypothetical protein B0H14DRAFT_3134415 [Mycena olivaceomarginata]